jgi:hypothetical protein
MRTRVWSAILVAAIVTFGLEPVPRAAAQTPAPAKTDASAKTDAPAKPPTPKAIYPKRFASPEDAVQAFVAALRAGDKKTLVAVLGSEGRTLVSSGDEVSDRQSRERFLEAYDAGNQLVKTDTEVTLRVGPDDWPFPVPLVKVGDRWRFDPRRGREEIIARRIGRNELNTMQVCLAYVDAQREYYAEDRNGHNILEYAQKFASTPGKRDGLYWTTKADEPPSPLGDFVVRAYAAGYRRSTSGGPTPYHGYLYRILTSQGPGAPGGAFDYVANGHMIGGFGLVAFPAEYGVSGVMTFIVNHEGVVYQKDLGPKTPAIATAMKQFNPDKTWTEVDVPK